MHRQLVYPSAERGVTLLELLIVLMLMALIAAIALPLFGNGVSTTELRGSARQLAAGLRAPRSETPAQRREPVPRLDGARKRLKVHQGPRQHKPPPPAPPKPFT